MQVETQTKETRRSPNRTSAHEWTPIIIEPQDERVHGQKQWKWKDHQKERTWNRWLTFPDCITKEQEPWIVGSNSQTLVLS